MQLRPLTTSASTFLVVHPLEATMKKILLLCGILAISASVASAAPKNNLAWDNCLGGGGLQSKVSACASNTGNNFLYSSVHAPAGINMWAAFEQELRFSGNDRTGVRP